MFKKFSRLFNAEAAQDAHAGLSDTASPPAYRCDLISSLRNQQKAILACLDQLGEAGGPKGVEHALDRLQELFWRYSAQETGQLYPFLEYYARSFGTDDGQTIRCSAQKLRALGQSLSGMVNRVGCDGMQPAEPDELRNQFTAHFRHKQTSVYPLYHQYGIQLIRIS